MKPYTERHLHEVIRDNFKIELNMPSYYPPIKAPHTDEGGVRARFMAAKAELPKEITVVRPFNTDAFAGSNAKTFYIAENGDDGNEGTKASPLATPHEALNRLVGAKGGKIVFRGGNYRFTKPLKINYEHSGTETSPLIITHEKGETAYVSSSYTISASAFTKNIPSDMKSRLKNEARENVLVADLKALGIDDYGFVGCGGASLIHNGEPMPLAQYPNKNEKHIMMTDTVTKNGSKESGEGWEMGTPEEIPENWLWQDDIYVYGALAYEWEHAFMRMKEIDLKNKKMSSVDPSPYSSPIRYECFNNYVFVNVFEELDEPGEWYLDRKTGLLYFWPRYEFEGTNINLVTEACDLIVANGASFVLVDGLDMGRCCGHAIHFKDTHNCLAQRLHITATDSVSGRDAAVFIDGGDHSGAVCCLIEHFSSDAATVSAGDRHNLIPANCFLQNNVLLNPHIRFGMSSGGCGNVVSHNYIKNTTMGDCGHNEGIIEYNVVEGGDTETHDSGMIYVGGGGCSSCGNHYRYNYFFDFKKNDYGIYFDDLSRGMYAYGNIVVGHGEIAPLIWESGGRSYNFHNGGEHCFYENISIDAGYFAFGGDISYYNEPDNEWDSFFNGVLSAAKSIGWKKYFDRNPTYKDFCDNVFEYEKLRNEPGYVHKSAFCERRLRTPYANNIENNLIFRAARPYKLDNGEESATGLDTNFITNEDPGFVDLEHSDYRFRDDAPVFKAIPGFTPPPFEKMGPVDDE